MSDNGTISLDWYPSRPSDRSDPTPIVIALTGIGGSSYEYHIRCLAKTLATQEEGKCSRLVVMNYRGASKTPLTTGKLYNAHDTNDYRNIVANISQQFPNAPLIGAGFSLGANLLTRYLGEQGSDSPLTAAISVCNPFDMSALGDAISANTAFNENVFHPVVTSAVKRMFVKNQSIIKSSPIGFDYDAVMKAKTTSELFLLALAKAYNFKDCQDYFHFASSTNYIHNIKTPFLAINTLDDHIAPASALPVRAIQENPYTALALLEKGGHLGLFCGVDSKIWYLNPMAEFVNGAIASKKIL
ncbi:hypothetical protein GGI04_002050 [Coemansia thaxteri]|nr:hypothetical protein GGI04_002050 [Coemansia thaxteri]KAJ2468998.1 hypothetical protein GGI02_003525 [Coemansia sp. RSA 2322]